jgi:hypothetical protein
MKRTLITFAFILLVLSMFLPNALGNALPHLTAPYNTNTPVIDGSMGSQEWHDAMRYRVNLTGPDNIETWVYLKHNGTHLCIGLLVWQINDHVYDEFIIFFDEGDDGGHGSGTMDSVLTANQEDLKSCALSTTGITLEDGCYKDSTFYAYVSEIDFNANCTHETDHGTTESEIEYWEGLLWVDDHWECEFAIPFVGNDEGMNDVSDLNCTTADTIGMKIQYYFPATSYYYPEGNQNQNGTYASLSFPSPTIESCTITGTQKDTFDLGETVYVNGSHHSPSTTYDFYIVNDVGTWTDSMPIPARVSGTAINVSSDSSGNILSTEVWSDPQTLGKYDAVVDVNGNGVYDAGIDALDDNDVQVTAGFVVPEFTSFQILLLFTLATLIAAIVYRRKH